MSFPSECARYEDSSIFGTIFSLVFAFGIGLSYVPQHLKIIHRKSSEGISPYFLLMGTASGISALANLICMSSVGIECCHAGLSKFECLSGQVGVIQVGTQTVAAALILIFCVYCTKDSSLQDKEEYAKIYRVYETCIVYTGIHVLVLILTFTVGKRWLYAVANLFGMTSTVLASLQYLPQIATIYKLKHPGSLSISMMCIQTPGGFVWCLTLMLSPGAIWSSWMPYLTAATLQGVLLAMCVYYGGWSEEGEEIEEIEEEIGERTSLLRGL